MRIQIRVAIFAAAILNADVTRADETGRDFFAEQVFPKLAENGCLSCHMPARGYVHPAMNYADLLQYLAIGQSAENNVLIYKLANQRSFAPDRPAHMGGQRCKSEDTDPCKTLKAWWTLEFGTHKAAAAADGS